MMRVFTGLASALVIAVPGAAQTIGAGDVVSPSLQREITECIQRQGAAIQRAPLACFERPGVTPNARALTRAVLERSGLGAPGILVAFHETGQVDVAEMFFPTFANTNDQIVLVNTPDGPFLAAELHFSPNPYETAQMRAVRARYPRAMESGRVTVAAVRPLPGGIQRFVLADVVTNGCRACEPIATSLRYFDFAQGRLAGFFDIGWQPHITMTTSRIEALIRAGDSMMIQARLNLMGYDAGPVDGIAGHRTRAAIADFRRDHCLSSDGLLPLSLIPVLASDQANFRPAPCAPDAALRAQIRLPFADGVYTVDERLCPPVPDYVAREYGDLAYADVISFDNGMLSQGENICDIVRARQTGWALQLELRCLAEGEPYEDSFAIEAAGPAGFSLGGRPFRLCPSVSVPFAPEDAPQHIPETVAFPVPGGWISANYGAHGPGPANDPDAYFAGQFHAAVDIAAVAGTPVLAPVSGNLVYYRQSATEGGAPDPVQTFAVLRDARGRDWVLAHMRCMICPDGPEPGDTGVYSEDRIVRDIAAGDRIGVVLDYPPVGSFAGDHLHLGLVSRPITEGGRLLPAFRRSGWALVSYTEGTAHAVEQAAANAAALGFLDPMSVLPRP